MKPLIEIHRVGPSAYSYRISAHGSHGDSAQDAGRNFPSLERCVLDAGGLLGSYFSRVELNFEGLFLGACDTEALRRQPRAVAQRIEQHFHPA